MGPLLTFQDQYQMAQTLSHFTDSVITTALKRDINIGASKLMASMNRAYLRRSRFTDLVSGQQYYTYPKDAQLIRTFITHIGGIARDLTEVTDEKYWNQLNQVAVQGIPTAFFVKGFEEVGLYPIPGSSTSSGGELVFTQRHVLMTHDDYTAGTVTVGNDSITVTGSGTNFTQGMVGRAFEVSDGSDGNWYRVAGVASATVLTLDNYFQGQSGSGVAYRIGECAAIPQEFLNSPTDYALQRFYLGRDQTKFTQYETLFNTAVDQLRSQYGRKAGSSIIDASHDFSFYDPLRSNISIDT